MARAYFDEVEFITRSRCSLSPLAIRAPRPSSTGYGEGRGEGAPEPLSKDRLSEPVESPLIPTFSIARRRRQDGSGWVVCRQLPGKLFDFVSVGLSNGLRAVAEAPLFLDARRVEPDIFQCLARRSSEWIILSRPDTRNRTTPTRHVQFARA